MEKLKEIRLKRKMTQQQVADKLKVSHATYWGYERGKYEPSIEILIKLSEIFSVSVDYLVGNNSKFIIDLNGVDEDRIKLIKDYADYILNSHDGQIQELIDKKEEEELYKETPEFIQWMEYKAEEQEQTKKLMQKLVRQYRKEMKKKQEKENDNNE